MEKSSNSKEMQCVGKLEIVSPKPVGFLCGSIPVPTDKSLHSFSSDLIPSSQTVSAPRYRMLPTETDLNRPPDTVLPASVGPTAPAEGVPWDEGPVLSNMSRKGEALAVSGLVDYGDEIDVIAPADIIKQIFKMPYSKARLSIAVQRVGQTLILNAGPDVEEGERLVRRNQPKSSNESLFFNFAMHSVRMEACDCPPTHSMSPKGNNEPSSLHDSRSSVRSSDFKTDKFASKEGHEKHSNYSKGKKDGFYWDNKKNKRNKASRSPAQETETNRREGNDEFLRVQFWQFHNFRMLLGSDLLVFSNEKYVSVSLHLWDISRQATPLAWLEAWLDNVMASVPELAICYHRNGVVKSYELLKTNDIFLLKGVSEDGSPAFHPYVVQQNGLSVLRFLQANCKQDPGAYWLYKNAGEDVIQLFDLSVIPQKPPESDDDCSSSLPSLIYTGRAESLLSLGALLYRIAHRLSLSMAPENRYKCAEYVRKCLDLLDEPDHLVVRAYAHEQFARLILNNDEELDLAEVYPLASEVTVVDHEEESLDIVSCISESSIHGSSCSDLNNSQDSFSEASGGDFLDINVSGSSVMSSHDLLDDKSAGLLSHQKGDEGYNVTPTATNLVDSVADPISSKLAAVHHISQAIKSLRWTRQLQVAEQESFSDETENAEHPTVPANFSICACGDADCIEVCDIREWLPTSKLDHKLWKLILLLGESYLALGEAYKEDDQLLQALKVVEVACSVYGSVPQYLEDAKFISSMGNGPHCQSGISKLEKQELISGKMRLNRRSFSDKVNVMDFSSTYLFWGKAWMLVGDVYVDFLATEGKKTSAPFAQTPSTQELKMSSEVVKELLRLKKKLGQDVENCSTCSLVNCSCQSDRVSSGNSASSSSDTNPITHSKRRGKRYSRNMATPLPGTSENNRVTRKGRMGKFSETIEPKEDFDTAGETHDIVKGIGERPLSPTEVEEEHEKNSSASPRMEDADRDTDATGVDSSMNWSTETNSTGTPRNRSGGIFKYLQSPGSMNADEVLSTALVCFESATKALGELPVGSHELQSVLKKLGWVCNELGRRRLQKKNLSKAEAAFTKAIDAFREVSDHTNIILIYCNMGHGRRAAAEEVVSKLEYLKSNLILRDAYEQAMNAAKLEYGKSIEFYGAAKSELSNLDGETDDILNGLRNEVYTQFANTYLRLGMLLGREDTLAYFYVNKAVEDREVGAHGRTKDDNKKSEISANDAVREGLSIYESLGELRKQEAAYAYFQLACYQKSRCLKFFTSTDRNTHQLKRESSILQRARQYLSLAEWNWQKALDFYSAKTHPQMYLTILTERAVLLSSLSSSFHSHTMLETALSCLLEGRHVSEKLMSESVENPSSEVYTKFWRQLQVLLKTMLTSSLPRGVNKAVSSSPASSSKKSGDVEKLKELYRMSLKSTDFGQLHTMHSFITVQDHKTEVADTR